MIDAARAAARKAIEALYYEGTCTIVEFQDVKDETTKITSQEEVVVYENLPCKLSFETAAAVNQTETAAAVSQGVKLFIAPEVKIKSGSKIVVTWENPKEVGTPDRAAFSVGKSSECGETHTYSCSGEPAVYVSHQEIMLELFRGWA